MAPLVETFVASSLVLYQRNESCNPETVSFDHPRRFASKLAVPLHLDVLVRTTVGTGFKLL
jgi:hypothetical protein